MKKHHYKQPAEFTRQKVFILEKVEFINKEREKENVRSFRWTR